MDDISGRGAHYPLSVGKNGGVAESSGLPKIEEAMRIILGTQFGERLMRPRFGCNLRSLAFAPNNLTTANLARQYVDEGLRTWEPRIELLEVTVDNDNAGGRLVIQITYRLRSTRAINSMIYPFYLEPSQ